MGKAHNAVGHHEAVACTGCNSVCVRLQFILVLVCGQHLKIDSFYHIVQYHVTQGLLTCYAIETKFWSTASSWKTTLNSPSKYSFRLLIVITNHDGAPHWRQIVSGMASEIIGTLTSAHQLVKLITLKNQLYTRQPHFCIWLQQPRASRTVVHY